MGEPGATTRLFGGTERPGVTHKLNIYDETHGGKTEGYITGNVAPDGRLREVFLHGFGKDGSTLRGWTDFSAILLSLALQADVDFAAIIRRVGEMKFEPYGSTDNPEIPYAPSVPAYIVCWLGLRLGGEEVQETVRETMRGWSATRDAMGNAIHAVTPVR